MGLRGEAEEMFRQGIIIFPLLFGGKMKEKMHQTPAETLL